MLEENIIKYLYFSCEGLSTIYLTFVVPSWSWSYGSWIYNNLFSQCLSPLTLWHRTSLMSKCTRYNIMRWNLLVTWGRSVVSSGTPHFSTDKTYRYNINWNIAESGVKHHSPNALSHCPLFEHGKHTVFLQRISYLRCQSAKLLIVWLLIFLFPKINLKEL